MEIWHHGSTSRLQPAFGFPELPLDSWLGLAIIPVIILDGVSKKLPVWLFFLQRGDWEETSGSLAFYQSAPHPRLVCYRGHATQPVCRSSMVPKPGPEDECTHAF